MQIYTVNITRVVWPHVTNLLDLRYFCQHNPLFYHLNLIPCHYKDSFNNDRYDRIYWASRFKRQKHGYKITVKTERVNKIIKYLIYFFFINWQSICQTLFLWLSPPNLFVNALFWADGWFSSLRFMPSLGSP